MRKSCVVLATAVICAGCGSVTPTHETITGYAIYDIKASGMVSPATVAGAVTEGLKEGTSGIQITQNIPPYPVPDQPGRFTLVNPLANSNLGALMGAKAASMTVPSCNGAFVIGNAQNSSMRDYGENTAFYICLWQYKEGYHLDFYTRFDRQSGGVNSQVLAATLMRPLTGDSSQFIPRTINNVLAAVQKRGMTPTLVESYPSPN